MLLENNLRIKRGDIFMVMKHEDGTIERRTAHNVIVDNASFLMAQLMSDNAVPGTPGTYVPGLKSLAVGTGDPGWDKQNPPPASASQGALVNELFRKIFNRVYYVDPVTFVESPLARTNVVEYETVYNDTEAVGALVEMALFGGNDATISLLGDICNYYTMPVWNKPSTSTLTITWRLTF
jgi:hypothetical protein